jgi:1,4-alpha-glucan branching enzyme
MIKKEPSEKEQNVRVTFTLPPAIWAESVHMVGEFNNWNRTSHPLVWNRRREQWSITLELARGKEYRFRYLVNGGEWHNDWDADRYEPNAFGGDNSVVLT